MQHRENVAFITLSVGNGLFSFLKINENAIIFDCGIGGNPINWNNNFQGNSNFPTKYMKEIGITKIENIFISHNHVDHYSNLKTISENFEIKNISVPFNFQKMNNQIKKYIKNTKAKVVDFRKQYKFLDITFENESFDWVIKNKLINKNENNNSMVLDFKFKNKSFLLTGDIENDATKNIDLKFKSYDYFQVPHHGSNNSGTINILKKISPDKCIVSGTRNTKKWKQYSGGHEFPTNDILDELKDSCKNIFITGESISFKGEYSIEYFIENNIIYKNAKTIQNT